MTEEHKQAFRELKEWCKKHKAQLGGEDSWVWFDDYKWAYELIASNQTEFIVKEEDTITKDLEGIPHEEITI